MILCLKISNLKDIPDLLECQWLLWRTFDIHKLNFLETKLQYKVQNFPKLGGMLILFGILRLPNFIKSIKLPHCKIKINK